MNFNADRLARLSGLGSSRKTEMLSEAKHLKEELEESCGSCGGVPACNNPMHDHDQEMAKPSATISLQAMGAPETPCEDDAFIFEIEDDEEVKKQLKEEDDSATTDETPAQSDSDKEEDELDARAIRDDAARERLAKKAEKQEESAALTMESLRDLVIELRDEILAESVATQQALTEAPVRSAIRKEIKKLLAEMPADAATNWMYGKAGKPTATQNKSRATALAGVGFKNAKH